MPEPTTPEQSAMRRASQRQAFAPTSEPAKKPQAAALGTDSPVADAPVHPPPPQPTPTQPDASVAARQALDPDLQGKKDAYLNQVVRGQTPTPQQQAILDQLGAAQANYVGPTTIASSPRVPAQRQKPPPSAVPAPAIPPITPGLVANNVIDSADAAWEATKSAGNTALALGKGVLGYGSAALKGDAPLTTYDAQMGMEDIANPHRELPPEPPRIPTFGEAYKAATAHEPTLGTEPQQQGGFTWDNVIDPESGSPVTTPGDRIATQQAMDEADLHDGATERKQQLLEDYRPGSDLTPVKEHAELYEASPVESPMGLLDPIDIARGTLQLAAGFVGSLLPDPDTLVGNAVQDYTGRLISNLADAFLPADDATPADTAKRAAWWAARQLPGIGGLLDAAPIVDAAVGTATGAAPRTHLEETQRKAGEDFYNAFASGRILDMGMAQRSQHEIGIPGVDLYKMPDGSYETELPWPLNQHLGKVEGATAVGGWKRPLPGGIDIIDTAIPPILARELAAHSDSDLKRWFYGNLTTHEGREFMGAAIEFVGDPLWIFGPAHGAELIYVGDKAYTIRGALARAAKLGSEVQGLENATGLRHIVNVVLDNEKAEEAAKFFDEALDAARKDVNKYSAELAENRTPKTIQNDRVAHARYEQLERGITLANRVKGTKAVEEAGAFAYHLPFSDTTRHLTRKFEVPTIPKVLDTVLLTSQKVTEAVDWLKPYSPEEIGKITAATLQKSHNMTALAQLSPGQTVAYAFYNSIGIGSNIGRLGWEALARLFGTRLFQPKMARAVMESEPGKFWDNLWGFQRLRKVPEEDWLAYNRRVSEMMTTTKALENDLMRRVSDGWKAAKETHARRKARAVRELQEAETDLWWWEQKAGPNYGTERELAQAKRRLERARRWNDPLYSVREVYEEAVEHHEAGSGRLGDLDHDTTAMAQTVRQLDDLRDWGSRKFKQHIDEVTQSIIAMSRGWSKGDLDRKKVIEELIPRINEFLHHKANDDMNAALEGLQESVNALLQQNDALRELRDSIGQEKLVEIIEGIRLAPNQGGTEGAIRGLLIEILGDAGSAEKVLRYAAMHAGLRGPNAGLRGLRELAVMASMRAPPGPFQDRAMSLLAGIAEFVNEREEEALKLYALAQGQFNSPEIMEALKVLIGRAAEQEIARAVELVEEPNWKGFVEWANLPDAVQRPAPAEWHEALEHWMAARRQLQARARVADLHVSRMDANMGGQGMTTLLSQKALLEERFARALGDLDVERRLQQMSGTANGADPLTVILRVALEAAIKEMPEGDYLEGALLDRLAERLARDYERVGPRAFTERIDTNISRALDAVLKSERRNIRDLTKEVKVDAARQRMELKKELERVTPRFEVPGQAPKEMLDWQAEVQNEFQKIVKESGLDPYQMQQAAFAAMRDGFAHPDWVNQHFKQLEETYGQVVGERYGPLPKDIEEATKQFTGLVKSYEALYQKYGFNFMKDPYERLRDWGVDAYAPHILDFDAGLRRGGAKATQRAALAARQSVQATGVLPRGISTLDQRLSIGIDADKLREMRGTIQDINNRATGSSDIVFTVDPELIVARYLQSNRAIAAKEFLSGMIHSKVAETFDDPLEAEKAGFTPLLRMKKQDDTRAGIWARWFDDVPEIARAQAIGELAQVTNLNPEDLYAGFRGALSPAVPDEVVWNRVAKQLNIAAGTATPSRTTGAYLEAYYKENRDLGRLYVPRAVFESMKDLYDLQEEPLFRHWSVDAYRRFQNFWKTRLTVISVAFSTRNAVSNQLSNILDLGVFGALNPKTQAWGAQMASAVDFADTWGQGSLKRAYENLQRKAEPIGGGIRQYIKEDFAETARHEQLASFKGQSLHTLIEQGVDLGDGYVRDIDEALELLRRNDVVSPSFTQFVDIGAWEGSITEQMLGGDPARTLAKAFEYTEGTALLTFPMFMAGGVVAPVALPKKWGEILARRVENQGRLVNFFGNMRRGGNLEDSYAHVAKFLFDYGDLNQTQRTWMRLLIPFFVWNQKNIALQLDMIQRSPALYNKFRQVFLVQGPTLLQAYGKDAEQPFMNEDMSSPERLAAMQGSERSQIHLPLGDNLPFVPKGMKNLYVAGFGTPIEAFAQVVGSLEAATDLEHWTSDYARVHGRKEQLRLLSMGSFVPLLGAEFALNWSFFYNKPVTSLHNVSTTGEILKGLNNLPFGVGPVMGNYFKDITTYRNPLVYNAVRGTWEEEPQADPQLNYYAFSKSPYGRFFNDSAALTEAYHLDLAADTLGIHDIEEETGVDAGFEPIPKYWRWLDAYFGWRIKQENADLDQEMLRRRIDAGVTGEEEMKGDVRVPPGQPRVR